MIRKIINLAIAAAILTIGIKGFNYLSKNKRKQPQKLIISQKNVHILTLKRHTITSQIRGFGISRGKREVVLTSEIEGKIVEIGKKFESGRMVAEGELLFRIDSRNTKAEILKIKGNLEKIKVGIEKLRQEEKNIRKRLEVSEKKLELFLKEFQNNIIIFKKGIISETVKNSSEKAYLVQEDQVISLNNEISLIPIKINEKKALKITEEAKLTQERLRLEQSVVHTPFSGIISEKKVDISQFIRAGEELGTLVDLDRVEIPVSIPAKNFTLFNFRSLSSKKKSISAEVLWTVKGRKFSWKGFVNRFEKLDKKTRTIKIIVEVKQNLLKNKVEDTKINTEAVFLTKGMFCEVFLTGRTFENALSIPINLLRENGKVYVYKDGKLEIKTPEILERFNGIAIISGDIKEGDKIITTSLKNPVTGMKLTVNNSH